MSLFTGAIAGGAGRPPPKVAAEAAAQLALQKVFGQTYLGVTFITAPVATVPC